MSEEDDIFKQEMEGVKPLNQEKKINLTKTGKTQQDPTVLRDHAEHGKKKDNNYLDLENITPVQPGEPLGMKKPGVQEGVYKKLRLGKYTPESHLDLHRLTIPEARVKVFDTINISQKQNQRCILITHGKGVKSKTPGKMKSHVNHWLQQIPDVLAFHSAQARDGGTGAVYVLLKKSEQKKQENREKYNR